MSTGTREFEAIVARAPSLPVLTGGLSASEVRRRLLHMTPGLLPFVLLAIPHARPWGPILVNIVLGIFATVIVMALTRFQLFARPGERDGRASVLGYAIPVLAALSLGHGREEIGLLTLIVLAFGDGAATLSGLTLGGKRLPWNPRKSWTGTLTFIGCATFFGTIVYWGEAHPAIELATAATIAFVTAVLCAMIESLPSQLNDNLRVGTAAAAISGALTLVLVG